MDGVGELTKESKTNPAHKIPAHHIPNVTRKKYDSTTHAESNSSLEAAMSVCWELLNALFGRARLSVMRIVFGLMVTGSEWFGRVSTRITNSCGSPPIE